jgi:putative PIN family toxin of toxin-antitoxin system
VAKDEPILRVLLDTNILVSAIISSGNARELFKKGIDGRFTLVISEPILEELTTVMRRPKFKTTEEEVGRTTMALLQTAEIVAVASNLNIIKEDPDDNKILNAAFDGGADVIVTGDHHLLELKVYKGIKIITLSDALCQC